jgi:hypothetical protein
MTQITIRQVDDALADALREAARLSGESMNALLLRYLRRQFLGGLEAGEGGEGEDRRNDLWRYRKGWVEDEACEEALREFGRIDVDAWR